MTRRAFDKKVEALESLRSSPDAPTTRDQLRKGLADRNNYLVARAAAIIADLRFDDLIPELLVAYDRFFDDPATTDPRCLAKLGIIRALRDLGHHDADAYLRGLTHVQLEPAWGGRGDLLLRLKLLLGDAQPDVMGQCFTSLLSLEADGAVAFVGRFLREAEPDVQLEAASALAECRDPHALALLRELWQDILVSIDLRRAILIGLGASPVPESAAFLLQVLRDDAPTLAETALSALATSRFRADYTARVAAAVAGRGPELRRLFAEKFTEVRARPSS